MSGLAILGETSLGGTKNLDTKYQTYANLGYIVRRGIDELLTKRSALSDDPDMLKGDPHFPDNVTRADYIEAFAIQAGRARNNDPALAHYRLTQLIELCMTDEAITSDPKYLKLLAEWVVTGTEGGDFLSVHQRIRMLEGRLVHHLSILTGGQSLEDLETIADDHVITYRTDLLQFITFFAQFYSYIGRTEDAIRVSEIGMKLSTLMCAAHPKLNLSIFRLCAIINSGGYNSEEGKRMTEICEAGVAAVCGFFRSQITPEASSEKVANIESTIALIEAQYEIVQLYGEISSIEYREHVVPEKYRDRWKRLSRVEGLDRDDQVKLAYIEVRLSQAIPNTDGGSSPIAGGEEGEEIVFDADVFLSRPDAKFYLGPIIEDFYHESELLSSSGTNDRNEVMRLVHRMLDIYRIAVGASEKGLDIFCRMGVYDKFCYSAGLVLSAMSDGEKIIYPISKVQSLFHNRQRLESQDPKLCLEGILRDVPGISSIIVDLLSSDESQTIFSHTAYTSGAHTAGVYKRAQILENDGRKYRITVIKGTPFILEDNNMLYNTLPWLLNYEVRKIVDNHIIPTVLTKDLHDIQAIGTRLRGILDLCLRIIDNSTGLLMNLGTIPNGLQTELSILERLRKLSTGEGFSVRDLAGSLLNRIANEQKIAGVTEVKPFDIGLAIEQCLGADCDLKIICDEGVNVLGYEPAFRILVTNLLQNATRYKKPDQTRASVRIEVKKIGNDIIFTIRDRGVGMSGRDIQAYLRAKSYMELDFDPNTSRAPGSTRQGVRDIMDYVNTFGKGIDIRSVVGEYTEITIRLPAGE